MANMDAVIKEEINQIVSRTDVTGNERAELIVEFTVKYAKKIITDNFCDGSPVDFEACSIEQLRTIHEKVGKLIDWTYQI